MRFLRTRLLCLLAVPALALAGAAHAATIDFVWVSTSGAGVGVGTPTLTGVAVSDTAVLSIVVTTPPEGILGVAVSALYDPSVVLGSAFSECPATASNPFGPGACGQLGGGNTPLNALGVANLDNVAGDAGSFAAVAPPPPAGGQVDTVFELAHITFTAAGAGTSALQPYFRPGVDGLVTLASEFLIPDAAGARIQVGAGPAVPEPGGALLFAVAAATFGLALRRQR